MNRRVFIKWLVATVTLTPVVASAKLTPRKSDTRTQTEKAHALFSGLIPSDASILESAGAHGIVAAIYESPQPGAAPDDTTRLRWLCLAIKDGENSLKVQVSSNALLQASENWNPVDVSLRIKGDSVEISEQKLRGVVNQTWVWKTDTWTLSKRSETSVRGDTLTTEEFDAEEAREVVATGRMGRDDFESVVYYKVSSPPELASYEGGSLRA